MQQSPGLLESLLSALDASRCEDVLLHLPRFKMEFPIDLKVSLRALGVNALFSEDHADLSGILLLFQTCKCFLHDGLQLEIYDVWRDTWLYHSILAFFSVEINGCLFWKLDTWGGGEIGYFTCLVVDFERSYWIALFYHPYTSHPFNSLKLLNLRFLAIFCSINLKQVHPAIWPLGINSFCFLENFGHVSVMFISYWLNKLRFSPHFKWTLLNFFWKIFWNLKVREKETN